MVLGRDEYLLAGVNMNQLKLWLIPVLLILAILGTVWLVRGFSQPEKLKEYYPLSAAFVPEVPTVAFCDLLANPTAYDMKLIRLQAVLVVNHDYRALYDPSCITKEPMVGVEPDSSLLDESSDAVPEKLYELVVRPESEIKEGSARVVMVGRFEGPNFRKDGRISRFQHRFIVIRLEKAEAVPRNMP
jgi:hypothetical protein